MIRNLYATAVALLVIVSSMALGAQAMGDHAAETSLDVTPETDADTATEEELEDKGVYQIESNCADKAFNGYESCETYCSLLDQILPNCSCACSDNRCLCVCS